MTARAVNTAEIRRLLAVLPRGPLGGEHARRDDEDRDRATARVLADVPAMLDELDRGRGAAAPAPRRAHKSARRCVTHGGVGWGIDCVVCAALGPSAYGAHPRDHVRRCERCSVEGPHVFHGSQVLDGGAGSPCLHECEHVTCEACGSSSIVVGVPRPDLTDAAFGDVLERRTP